MVQQKKRTRTTAKGKENAPDRHPLQRNVGIVVRDEQNVNDIRINEAKQMSNKGKEKAIYAMGNANEWIQPLRDKNIGIVIRDERDHNVIHVGNGNQNSRVDGGNTIDFYINVVALSVGLNSLLLHPSSSIECVFKDFIALAATFDHVTETKGS
ncbi:hypothetical protein RHGRI_030252 [Rhododendron griersonianum]|uniref:Uncharacterized protein n=1 Tax=Rhododendron griersonianum TaxID=479676 RepID=A0AAV6IM67_9ERIC|nr:hypothetical protein RHGRI_030252 [Rhododendron griersonianum]KAG5529811.1 hypothetical protein RHGRI_030252 [Rhododendron griersonianum]